MLSIVASKKLKLINALQKKKKKKKIVRRSGKSL